MLFNINLSVHGDSEWEKVNFQVTTLEKRVCARIEANYQGYRSVFMLIIGLPMPIVFEK